MLVIKPIIFNNYIMKQTKKAFIALTAGFWLMLIIIQGLAGAPQLNNKPLAQETIVASLINGQTNKEKSFFTPVFINNIASFKNNLSPQYETYYVTITAYSSTVGQCDRDPFITASNKNVRDGVIATNFLPFGTKVIFPDLFGSKIFIVEDRMNKKYNDRVDIWMPYIDQAKDFGIQTSKMIVL